MPEHVILFAGPMGAGKTTAIKALSEIPVITTEAANSDRETSAKETTTVALDYGEITLDGVEKVRLYGVPGQRRFSFMWRILEKRAIGLVLLVNNDARDPIGEVLAFIKEFDALHHRGGVVVGVTRTDVKEQPGPGAIADAIQGEFPEISAPVFAIDARDREHMIVLLSALLVNLESIASAMETVS
jgi:hypothetical protein